MGSVTLERNERRFVFESNTTPGVTWSTRVGAPAAGGGGGGSDPQVIVDFSVPLPVTVATATIADLQTAGATTTPTVGMTCILQGQATTTQNRVYNIVAGTPCLSLAATQPADGEIVGVINGVDIAGNEANLFQRIGNLFLEVGLAVRLSLLAHAANSDLHVPWHPQNIALVAVDPTFNPATTPLPLIEGAWAYLFTGAEPGGDPGPWDQPHLWMGNVPVGTDLGNPANWELMTEAPYQPRVGDQFFSHTRLNLSSNADLLPNDNTTNIGYFISPNSGTDNPKADENMRYHSALNPAPDLSDLEDVDNDVDPAGNSGKVLVSDGTKFVLDTVTGSGADLSNQTPLEATGGGSPGEGPAASRDDHRHPPPTAQITAGGLATLTAAGSWRYQWEGDGTVMAVQPDNCWIDLDRGFVTIIDLSESGAQVLDWSVTGWNTITMPTVNGHIYRLMALGEID